MKKLIVAAFPIGLAGLYAPHANADEGLYLELGATVYLKGLWGGSEWIGNSPGARIDLYYQWDNQPWYLPDKVGYFHQSNWLNGPPFNSEEFEDHIDYLYASKVFDISKMFR